MLGAAESASLHPGCRNPLVLRSPKAARRAGAVQGARGHPVRPQRSWVHQRGAGLIELYAASWLEASEPLFAHSRPLRLVNWLCERLRYGQTVVLIRLNRRHACAGKTCRELGLERGPRQGPAVANARLRGPSDLHISQNISFPTPTVTLWWSSP